MPSCGPINPADSSRNSIVQSSVSQQSLDDYWRDAKQYPRYVWGIGTLLPITILVHQFLPQLVIAAMLSRLSKGQFTTNDLWGSFGWLLVLYAALRITSATVMWRWVIIMLDRLEANVLKAIANQIFDHLLRQSQSFHANQFSGTLVSQTTKYMSGYVRLAEATVMQIVPLVLAIVFTCILLLPKAPHFVVALILFAAAYTLIIAKATRKVRVFSAADAKAQSEQTGQLADTLSNILTVKSFAATTKERQNFANITENTRQKTLAHTNLHNSRQLYFSLLTSSITSCSVVLAMASVVLFDADIAIAFLVLDYSTNIVAKLWSFSAILRDINRAFGESHDMTQLLRQPPSVTDPVKPQALRIRKGEITFSDVAFTHPDASETLFRELTLTIKPGEKIGLVGKSGAGKTTLTKLLLRFSDIDAGKITIDGQNIAAITQDDLRSTIAYVPQEPLLFHRTIRENIGYGKRGVSHRQIVAAARKAHAHEFIMSLPHKYDTLVGERGVKLSGGQRQRIAIARAIVKDAPILVLDEATSALDSESEKLIQKALKELMEKRTAIVIAHRLSTIQKMDRIVVMDNGTVIEQGTHAELLAQGGAYATLWGHQSGGFIED